MQLKQELKPTLKQEQWLKLQMMQLMKILQLPQLELRNIIQAELEKNPLLEIKESKDGNIEDMEKQSAEPAPGEQSLAETIAQCGAESEIFPYRPAARLRKSTAQIIESTASRPPSLHNHLVEQFYLHERDFLETKIGEFLIGNIDERGYLRIGTRDAAELLKVDESAVENVLKVIHDFDPPGVGARDLSECLLMQVDVLKMCPEELELFKGIITTYLEDLARGRFNKIAKALNTKEEVVRELDLKIKELNPYPGQSYFTDEVSKVVPEIIVSQNEGRYEVVLDGGRIPNLRLSPLYLRMLREKDKDSRKYLRERAESARGFIKSLNQRRELVQKISETLLRMQGDFFEKGINYLKPLTLEEVARVNNVHPSTVSRAIANKYMQTPRGIFPLKFFFSVPVSRDVDVSSRSIKDRIAALIESEDSSKPLSDKRIVEQLKVEGIEISRRTVAKYREATGISSTFKRRKK